MHITAHLGGGVGTVLSKTSIYRKMTKSNVEDVFVCLEKQEKDEVVTLMRNFGIDIYTCPGDEEIADLIKDSDIVQIEWWHHPLMARWMCTNSINARLIIWSHTSGLHYPVMPDGFMEAPHSFMVTSSVTRDKYRKGVIVNSSGGFADIPLVDRSSDPKPLKYGYVGSLNPAKLHPKISDFIDSVEEPDFKVDFFGDVVPSCNLKASEKIILHGHTNRPHCELRDMDVFVYILNPDHYGTTENALLEAMASGVVPIVLNNAVEQSIVKNGHSGIVVDSLEAFSRAVRFLSNNPGKRSRMSYNALTDVRREFSLKNTVRKLDEQYMETLQKRKKNFHFSGAFGFEPSDWFYSCLGKYKKYFSRECKTEERLKNPILYERSKGSVFHYNRYFKGDQAINHWASILREDMDI